ncbi:MAG: 5'-nucleotidase SurE, partial [Deltaproteobacteria bacterium]|nr:5'-nucleotidase SurE [Deltaproteobacteria bacterium]
LRGIPAIAFSLGMAEGSSFDAVAPIARAIALRVLALPARPKGTRPPLFNVNFPAGVPHPAGLRATKLGHRRYEDEVDVRRDPRGREYFWIGGPNAFHDPSERSDTEAVDQGLVSITPLGLDATSSEHMELAAMAIAGIEIAAPHPASNEDPR